MRRIVIVGAGQSGLLLGLGLQKYGYEVTMIAEKEADAVRSGPMVSAQLVFDRTLALERELGVHFWLHDVKPVREISFTAANTSDALVPAIAWSGRLEHPGNGVDQRLRVAAWLEEFGRRGGDIRYRKATPETLEELAREFELVVVATGRGPQFEKIFRRNDEFSPYREPQRAIGAFYARVPEENLTNSMRYAMGPVGELAITPALLSGGPALGVGMFGIPGGPLDVWDAVTDTEQHFETARKLIETHFPWRAEILEHAEPAGPLDSLRGSITPVVRHPVGVLPSGARVLALGDAAVTTDPLSGQGGNLAGHAARSYRDAIVAHGDRAFDEEFKHAAFARYWAHARHASRFNNDLLAPPSDLILATFQTAQADPEVADRFVHTFEDPETYTEWLTDEA